MPKQPLVMGAAGAGDASSSLSRPLLVAVKGGLGRIPAAVALCLALLSSAASGQEIMSSAGSGTLTQAVRAAVNGNPQVQAAWHGFRASRQDVGVARGGYLPSVDLSGGVGVEERSDDGRGSYDTDFVELTLTQMIYDGFATASEVERLDHAALVRYYELLDASEQVALDVARAYLDVRRYRELVELARANYREHRQVFDQIEARVRSGAGRRVDLEQISGRLALAESNLMTEAANLHDVSARFQRLVGELPPASLAPAPALNDQLPAAIDEALRLAYEGNPAFHAAIENLASVQAARDGERSAFHPRLEFRARTGSNNENDVIGRRDQSAAELVASVNLYRGGSDRASFRAASERIEQARGQRSQQCTELRQTVQIAYQDTRRLREQLGYLEAHRQSIGRVRGAYQQQFDIGQRSLLDVLDSENEYFEASRAFVNAKYDVRLADARTLGALGRLLPALGVRREDTPTLAELSYEGVALDPEDICPVQSPSGYTLDELIGPNHAEPPYGEDL